MDGQPLPVEHGAPLRLRVEVQLGFTMVKWIRAIEFVESYAGLGQGQGGWCEDNAWYSQTVPIWRLRAGGALNGVCVSAGPPGTGRTTGACSSTPAG